MKILFSILLGAVLESAVVASGEDNWAYVPASRDSRSIAGFAIDSPLDESAVRLVGGVIATTSEPFAPIRVLVVDTPSGPSWADLTAPKSGAGSPAIPAGARWPDAHGRIAAILPESDKVASPSVLRNPWEVRVIPRSAGRDIVFECGGMIAGGEGGPVAFLNGRIVRRGDVLGEFAVAGVLADCVMLERRGSVFVIPRGRRTTVTTGGN